MTTITAVEEVVARGKQRRLDFEAEADIIRGRSDMAWPAKRRKITAAWEQARADLRELRGEYEEAQKTLTRRLYNQLMDLGDVDPDSVIRAEFIARQVMASTNR